MNVAKKGAMHEKEKGRENMRQRRARECARDRKRQREREREREEEEEEEEEKEHNLSTLATCWKTKASPSCFSMPDEAQASR